jgi:hypothetical protein
MTPLAPLAEAP